MEYVNVDVKGEGARGDDRLPATSVRDYSCLDLG